MPCRRDARLNHAVLILALCAGLAAVALLTTATDTVIFLWVNAILAALPDTLLPLLSMLGLGAASLLVLSPALLLSPRVVGAALFALPLGLLLTHVPKNLLRIPRPLAVLDAAQVHVVGAPLHGANSMPSGHALTAMSVATVLVLGARGLQRRPLQGFAILGVALAVCIARIGVGAHWPSDVLAGAALGLLNGWAAVRAAERCRATQGMGGHAAVALLVLVCAADLVLTDAVMPEASVARNLLVTLGIASVAGWGLTAWRRRATAPGESGVAEPGTTLSRARAHAAARCAADVGTGSTAPRRADPAHRA